MVKFGTRSHETFKHMLERSRTGGEHAREAAYIGAFKVWKHHQACKMVQVSPLQAHDEVCAIAPWFSWTLQRCTNKMFDECKKTVLAVALSHLARTRYLGSFPTSSRRRLFLQRTASWIDGDCSRLFQGVRNHTDRLGLVSCHAHVFHRAMAKASSFPHQMHVPRAISWPCHRHRPWR